MANVGEDDEYESDPEQAKLSLTMRRREASDDEEDVEDAEEREVLPVRRVDSRVSDCESDGQGAADDYDEEESDLDEEEYEEEVEEAYYEEGESGIGHGVVEASLVPETEKAVDGDIGREVNNQAQEETREDEKMGGLIDGEFNVQDDQYEDNASAQVQEEKKESEPFAVPTAGAFYMHDDRLRGAGSRHGRTFGEKKLWGSKDDQKWGHDKFVEMTMQERHYEDGRRGSRGRNRGRGRSRVEDRGYSQGNRPKPFNNNNQNNVPKVVRGRGPRRYVPTFKRNSDAPIQSRQTGKSADEKSSHASSSRASVTTSSLESAPVQSSRSNVFASSLSSASPPFYPSGSSNKEVNLTQKRDLPGPINRNLRSPVMRENFSVPQSNNTRGKNLTDFIGMDKLHIDDSAHSLSGKPQTNLPVPVSGPPFISSTQPPLSRVRGRGSTPSGQMAYQTTVPPHNHVNRASPNQHPGFQRAPVQNRLQPPLHASAQQLGQHSGGGSQVSSPPKAALSIHSIDSVESESAQETSNSKTALVGKGKGNIQGSGMGSFPYVGAQVLGPAGGLVGGHGDQNFPFLPVMQFGGQHPGGIPAVGMAFPGYVSQPNGGNSEMTWLPVLAGAAGALGATYCSPYLTVDGAYHARPSGQPSSLAIGSSKENNGSELKPSQRPELANDELGQRQNKPRRYTEMKFDQ